MIENKTSVKTVGDGDRFLSFSVGTEEYAVPLLKVKEVIAVPETTPIPYAPTHFKGIMNLRGQVISVLDLRTRLGVKPKPEAAENAVIILDLDPVFVGVTVDSVNSVLNFQKDEIQVTPDLEHKKSKEFLSGIARSNDRFVLILELAKVLDVNDMSVIKKAA